MSEPLPSGSSSSSSGSSGTYDCVASMDGDTILEQTRTEYDEAGNVTMATLWRRLHNATGTGRLNSLVA